MTEKLQPLHHFRLKFISISCDKESINHNKLHRIDLGVTKCEIDELENSDRQGIQALGCFDNFNDEY